MILVSQWYEPEDETRKAELAECRRLNEETRLLDAVDYVDGVWTFGELVDRCHEKYAGKACVVANTDISFESSWGLRSLCKPGRLVALTRWENPTGPRFLGHQVDDRFFSGSQDAWAFIAGTIPAVDMNIPLGMVGCDNVIAGWAIKNGVEVINPALSIKTFHHHSSRERPDRPSVFGLYAYPELTTVKTTGMLLCHEWPTADGRYEYEMGLHQCQP
jgi:hypothetical protein